MLHVTLFGSPTLTINNQPIEISRRKAIALFLYLVVTNRPHTRDHLCVLLWSRSDSERARAELRRMLSALNKTALSAYIEADRQNIWLVNTDTMWVDLWDLETILNAGDWTAFLNNLDNWFLPFLQGFSAGDAPQFDDWQSLMFTQIRQRLIPVMEQLVSQTHAENQSDCIRLLKAWLKIEPENDGLHRWLMRCYVEFGNPTRALNHYQEWYHYLEQEHNRQPESETINMAERIRNGEPLETPIFAGGVLPPLPHMLIGRDDVIKTLREKLGVGSNPEHPPCIVMQGWPGIGKTTLTASLAHDPIVQNHFRDGVLWVSLGQSPDIFTELVRWGQALQIAGIEKATSIEDATMLLSSSLHDKRTLLIVDDVWDTSNFVPFKVGGAHCATLVTTRLNQVANTLITERNQLFKVPVLNEERSLDLLKTLAPDAVESYPDEVHEMIRDLEGLPLALQVVGRLLREEHMLGWGAQELLYDLREGTRLLTESAPVDRQAVDADSVPLTIIALLNLSTNSLDNDIRKRFALLSVFAPKPAVFELEAMQAVWEVEDARPTIRRLVERGLLDVVPGGEFQMHALLVQHARKMFQDNHVI